MLKGKQRSVWNGSPDMSVPLHIGSISPDAILSPDPSESIHLSTSSKTIVPKAEPWSLRQDETQPDRDRALHVTFVRSLIHKDRVQCVQFSADGEYLAVTLWNGNWHDNGTIIIYNAETGTKNCTLAQYASQYSSEASPSIYCMCFSPNSRILVVGDTAGRVTVWDIPNKRIRNIFRGHDIPVESVDFSPNGRFVASASWDLTLRIWNMRDGSAKVLSDIDQGFFSVRFCPNGDYVVGGNGGGILTIWNLRTGQLVDKWIGHQQVVHSVAFTPDGRGLVSGSRDGSVKYWDVGLLGIVHSGGMQTVTETLEYKGHAGIVNSVAISPDARWVASTSYDKTAILWDTRTAVRQCTLVGHKEAVLSVDFSPAGSCLATGSNDGHVNLWRYIST